MNDTRSLHHTSGTPEVLRFNGFVQKNEVQEAQLPIDALPGYARAGGKKRGAHLFQLLRLWSKRYSARLYLFI
jgi:hypothetical protein